MKLSFYGTRGSIPTPGPQTVKYGGNTACTVISHDDDFVILDSGFWILDSGFWILDSGTGIRVFGE